MPNFEHTFCNEARRLHKTLMRFGWAYNPHFASGVDCSELEAFAKSITPEQKKTRDSAVTQRLHRLLYRCAFHPHFRAYQLVRASKLPFISEFSHHFEAAHAHYYRGDYLSAVLTFVPAIEGIMRAHARETIADVMAAKAVHENKGRSASDCIELDETDALIPDLIGALRARPIPDKQAQKHDHWRTMLNRDLLCDMLTDWLFCPIAEAEAKGNYAITFLNRNGIQHAFRADCYYTQADVGRLFLLMDIYVELIRHELAIPTSVFLPDIGQDSQVDERNAFFIALMVARTRPGELGGLGRHLLGEHKNYRYVEDFTPLQALVEDRVAYEQKVSDMLNAVREGKPIESCFEEQPPEN